MAILTEAELKERLEHPNNVANIIVNHKKIHNGGRRDGDKNIEPKKRELAGFLAHFDTAKNIGEALDISPIQVHMLKHGKVSHDRPNGELKEAIEERLGIVRDKALDKLLSTIDVIQEEKISKLKVTSQTRVAKDLASVIEKTSKKNEGAVPVQFNIYAPQIREEKHFDVVEVRNDG